MNNENINAKSLEEKISSLENQLLDLETANKNKSSELKKYKIIFESSLDVVMITDGKAGKILEISKSSKNLLGYWPEELIGQHYSVLLPASKIPVSEKILNETEIYGSVLAAREVRKKDGSFCNMDLTINIIEWGDEKVVCTNLRDITERLKHEAEIQRISTELRELNASKDKFFSIIAHDLKSPFTGLLGYSEIVNEDFDSLTNDQLKSYFTEIHSSAKAIYNLLNNLLEWSWISIGNQSFNPARIDLVKISRDVIDLLNPNAINKNIEIIFSGDDKIFINADETMIRSVIQNLLSNAIKFTPRNGHININLIKTPVEAVIIIRDTGVGISENEIANLFRLDKHNSTLGTEKEKGTGLGLLIAKELVEKNSGTISVQSKLNEGTIFKILFPRVTDNSGY
ncbi:MAG: PAS domain-containing sensor histidine kinase [Ignavibacteriales bacterium]|nr:MAG: PAS domain-containing sensor histidine kinase [Ignavibacteriales bacterium]